MKEMDKTVATSQFANKRGPLSKPTVEMSQKSNHRSPRMSDNCTMESRIAMPRHPSWMNFLAPKGCFEWSVIGRFSILLHPDTNPHPSRHTRTWGCSAVIRCRVYKPIAMSVANAAKVHVHTHLQSPNKLNGPYLNPIVFNVIRSAFPPSLEIVIIKAEFPIMFYISQGRRH